MRHILLLLLVVGVPFQCLGRSFEEGLDFYCQGSYDKADEVFSELLRDDSLKSDVLLDIAAFYKERGDYNRSIALFEEIISTSNNKALHRKIFPFLGELYYLKGDEEAAFKIFTTIERSKNADWRTSLYLGLLYEDQRKVSQAIKYYKRTLKEKESSLASYELAKLLYAGKKFREAIKYFQRTIAIDPSIRMAYYYLSLCLYKSREYEEAYKTLAKAVNFYPQNTTLKNTLASVKKKLGEEYFLKIKEDKEKKRERIKLSPYQPRRGDIPMIKVKILEGAQFTFKGGSSFYVSDGETSFKARGDTFYTLIYKGINKIVLVEDESAHKTTFNASSLKITTGNWPLYFLNVIHGKGEYWQKGIDNAYRGDFEVVVGDESLVVVNVLNMEEYLYGVIAAEIPASAPDEALKAQAVAARTIAMRNMGRHKKSGYNFCSDTHCQVYRGITVETKRIKKAVDDTFGEVIAYEGNPIEAFYHSNCGGCLRGDVFGEKPYLFSNKLETGDSEVMMRPWQENQWFKQTPQSYSDISQKNFRWQRVYDEDDFQRAFGFPLSKLKEIAPLSKGDCAYLRAVLVRWQDKIKSVEGDLPIRNFFEKLKSSAFKAELKYSVRGTKNVPTKLFIWGAGFGHGSGMSQTGAIGMAQEGYTYKQILTNYYKNVTIEKLY